VQEVAADDYAWTLWAYLGLAEIEDMDALMRDGEGLQAAERTAMAFHEPARLQAERTELRRRAGLEMPAQDAMDRAAAMVQRMRKAKATH
jgi:hypothetical protein